MKGTSVPLNSVVRTGSPGGMLWLAGWNMLVAEGTGGQPGRDGSLPGGQVKVRHRPGQAPLCRGSAPREQGCARGGKHVPGRGLAMPGAGL